MVRDVRPSAMLYRYVCLLVGGGRKVEDDVGDEEEAILLFIICRGRDTCNLCEGVRIY